MGMQVDELPQATPDVDYTQILPIQQKRTIAFVNHFIMNTVSFLNNFAQSCESRFMEFEYKIQKIEASLLILEAQLSSIPEFEKSNLSTNNIEQNNDTTTNTSTDKTSGSSLEERTSTSEVSTNKSPESEKNPEIGTKASEDPRFARFFKMLRVGVQEQAVKLKMQSEGFDPSILDNPDAIMPESKSAHQEISN